MQTKCDLIKNWEKKGNCQHYRQNCNENAGWLTFSTVDTRQDDFLVWIFYFNVHTDTWIDEEKRNTLKLNQKILFKRCFGLSQCVHITYLCLAVQNHPTGDHTIPLCSELCDVVAFVTMANEFWAQPEIEIEHKLSEWDYLGIHLAQFCYYDVYKTFYVTVDDNRRHSPNTVVSSGISSIKHFRSVSPIWKYNALHCTINASANNANVSFLLTIVAAASRELWEDTTWYFQFCLMPKVKWHQIQ